MSARSRRAGASILCGVAAAALPAITGGAAVRPQLLLAGFAVIALLGALAGWSPGFALAAIALGSEYALRLVQRHGHDRLDALAIIEAVAIFATIETGLRALDARSIAVPERAVRRAAAVQLAAMLLGAGGSAFVVLALGSRRLPAPTAGLALGLAAAAVILIAAERLRRRVTRSGSPG